jgi:hypothetical protein
MTFTSGGEFTSIVTVAWSVPPLPSEMVYVNVCVPSSPFGLNVYVPEGLTVSEAPDGSDITVEPGPFSTGVSFTVITVSLSPSGSESFGNIVEDTGTNGSVVSESSSAAGTEFLPLISTQAMASFDAWALSQTKYLKQTLLDSPGFKEAKSDPVENL